MPYKNYEEGLRKNREYKRQRIQYAKDNSLCIQCMQPIEEYRQGKATCKPCTDKRVKQITEDRAFFKQMGICPRCRKNKLEGSEKTCVECKAKQAEYAAKIRADEEGHRHYLNICSQWDKKHRAELEEQGLCNRCGKRNADDGYKTCSWCRAKRRVYNQNRTAQIGTTKQRRIDNGLCIWCENPIKEGYKVCEKHYQMNVEKAHKVDRSKFDTFIINPRKYAEQKQKAGG